MGKDIVTTERGGRVTKDLFCDISRMKNSQYLSIQHPFVDIYLPTISLIILKKNWVFCPGFD